MLKTDNRVIVVRIIRGVAEMKNNKLVNNQVGSSNSHLMFTLKVTSKFDKKVYKIITIDEDDTLDELCNIILSSFDFDSEHLYMFSLNNKPYDKKGYYSHCDEGRMNSTNVKLGKLGLHEKDKFMLLYDFGDEWEFNILVKKVQLTESSKLSNVIEEKGELNQYFDSDEFRQ
jgi:hypothetical protein